MSTTVVAVAGSIDAVACHHSFSSASVLASVSGPDDISITISGVIIYTCMCKRRKKKRKKKKKEAEEEE